MEFYKFTYRIKEYDDDPYSAVQTITIGATSEEMAEFYLCFQRYPHHYVDIIKTEEIRPTCVVVKEVY